MSVSTAETVPHAGTAQQERIARNFAHYDTYVQRAQSYLAQGELAAAAVHCAIAAQIATQNHCGVFWSPRLEKVLNAIGRRIGPAGASRPALRRIERILHVCSRVTAVGGHTKLLCNWVKADAPRRHALVLTGQRGATPEFLRETFNGSNGLGIEHLNQRPGGQLEWAKRLRSIAADFDIVVLHTDGDDVLPAIAFAETRQNPPALVLNHADHLFWFDPSVCHLSINLRDAAQDLAIERRGIAPERNILMPTLSEGIVRQRSREEAKRELGIDPNVTLMVSAARKPKYRTLNGVSYADIHAPVLEKYPNATLLIVGAGDPEDWASAKARFGDRFRSLPEQANPRLYFEAADIYVDSYPFVSSTSLMEAAGYGLPLVTIFTYPETARIFGINHIALVGNVMQATSFEQYRDMLGQLIEDPALRARLGAAAGEAVRREHNLPGWKRWMEAAYARALELPPLDNRAMLETVERPAFGEPDCSHEDIFGGNWPTARVMMNYLGVLPPHQQLAHWNEVRRQGAFTSAAEAASYFVPEWLKRYVKDGVLKRS